MQICLIEYMCLHIFADFCDVFLCICVYLPADGSPGEGADGSDRASSVWRLARSVFALGCTYHCLSLLFHQLQTYLQLPQATAKPSSYFTRCSYTATALWCVRSAKPGKRGQEGGVGLFNRPNRLAQSTSALVVHWSTISHGYCSHDKKAEKWCRGARFLGKT